MAPEAVNETRDERIGRGYTRTGHQDPSGRRAGHAVLGNARIVVNVGAGGTDREMWKVAGDFCHASAMCLALAKLNDPSADFCV